MIFYAILTKSLEWKICNLNIVKFGFRISNCWRWEYYVYRVDMCSQIQIFLKKWEYLSLEGHFFGDCSPLIIDTIISL